MSCIVTPAGSKDTHRETGDTEKKGGPKKNEKRERGGEEQREERDSGGDDIDDSQRPWSPSEISTLGL